MKRKLRGFKRSDIELDFNLYRVDVPIVGMAGDKLSVIDIQPEGVERTILLVHGYAGCAETWEHQINHFSKQYRVVIPDIRGHGQSDAPFSRYTMDEMIIDLYQISQYLDLPDKFILVGHSFGGSICVEYANSHPEQIERLVLIATGGEYPLPKIASLLYRLPTAFFRPWWKYRPRWNAEIHVLKRMILNNMRNWVGWSSMKNLQMPVLVITGARDNYFPRRVFEDVGTSIPGAEIVDVGASKHKVQLERHRAVNRAIERYIDESKKSSSWRSLAGSSDLDQKRPWLEVYSERTPRTVPIPRRPLHDFLRSAAEWLPKRTATIFFKRKMNYAQLNKRVNQFGHALRGMGVTPSDRVMIVLPNMPEFIIAYYGALCIGSVAVLSNPDADVTQIIRELNQTGAKVLVTLRDFSDLIYRADQESAVHDIILVDFDKDVPDEAHEFLLKRWRIAGNGKQDHASVGHIGVKIGDLTMDAPYEAPPSRVHCDDLAAILYTSGTTDDPKGVCLTHFNLVANALQTRHWVPDLGYGKETFLSVVPLLHSYGMTTTMNLPITVGGTILLLPFFEPKRVLELVGRHKPTIFPGTPSIYAVLTQVPGARSYGLSSIRACISGSSPLPVEVQESFEKLTRGRLVEGYGLTEASPVTHANPFNDRHKPGSIGVPLPNTDAKIVDLASGNDVEPGQIGQLYVKGPQVTSGYWQQDEETEKIFHDGWLDTGDVSIMDVDGYFHIIGRTRDLIRAGEHTVYPRDVEELLYENTKVREVAVVGIPQAAQNQKVKAYVVPREGTTLSKDELIQLCKRRLEPFEVPWEIEFRDELPKSFTGKVIRRLLVS